MTQLQPSTYYAVETPRPCPVAAALEVVGERWSLLVIRELFYEVRRFDRIAQATGAPRNILASRLRDLEAAGVIARSMYSKHPPRYEYHLTRAGRDLLPVLLALREWGEAHTAGPTPDLLHRCDRRAGQLAAHPLHVATVCVSCGDRVRADDLVPGGPVR
jgi:DNA-binding HxlR family transcriptional regulator